MEVQTTEGKRSGCSTAVIIAVVGIVALLCLIPVIIIAVLTLMGPQIGDVFTRIITELGTPVP